MWRCGDVEICGCGHVEKWTCVDVEMEMWRCRCGDVEMWMCGDVEMWRCVYV